MEIQTAVTLPADTDLLRHLDKPPQPESWIKQSFTTFPDH